jgi:hypothetical protein
MYFGSGLPQLNNALKNLRVAWDQTEEGWRDSLRTDFEEHHVDPFVSSMTNTLRAMDQLSDVFARIYRECSDPK